MIQPLKSYSLLFILNIISGAGFVAIRVAGNLLTPVNLEVPPRLIAAGGYLVILPFLGKMKVNSISRIYRGY